MRQQFARALVDLAERDDRVVLLTGDLGFTVLEPFAERFPERFFNVGVAEQNMVGIATGLAESGFVPFTYSIATFASLRPYEFIRNGAVLHELPVRFVGVGSGLDYGYNGVTHYALEDVGLMRLQPGLTTVVPADPAQAGAAVAAIEDHPGPVYLRIGKGPGAIPGLDGRFELGRAEILRTGTDLALIALGPAAGDALEAASLLEARGIEASVALVSSFNPSPVEDLLELVGRVPVAVTVESHYRDGGLGSLVAEVVAEHATSCRVVRCGVAEMPRGRIGTVDYLNDVHGLSGPRLAETAVDALQMAT